MHLHVECVYIYIHMQYHERKLFEVTSDFWYTYVQWTFVFHGLSMSFHVFWMRLSIASGRKWRSKGEFSWNLSLKVTRGESWSTFFCSGNHTLTTSFDAFWEVLFGIQMFDPLRSQIAATWIFILSQLTNKKPPFAHGRLGKMNHQPIRKKQTAFIYIYTHICTIYHILHIYIHLIYHNI